MRQKKIRGQRRRQKQVDKWCIENTSANLNDYLLNQNGRYYAKIRISPWSEATVTKSRVPQPTRKTRQKILGALLDIYESWKNKLDTIGQPYYLKIWFFEPRFAQSQVVCAIGNSIGFYENTFFKPEVNNTINFDSFGTLKAKAETLNWEYYLDEDHYDNSDLEDVENYATKQEYIEAKTWLENLLKKPHRTHKFININGGAIESYSFKRGNVWIGGRI